ncbi:hypothetical protein [Aureliella helgolandensis]|uniref:Secreted protein n=1 Tax=Aureliella helgolandensis TaxID=2527968 RepID=A0A518GDJ2_9BACT|nr:hypothetical protein [Aureliella helgolandensis]QDV26617.1 hypothetical protein Q31a_49910 [Aureliella helgolandensis]
MRRFTFLRLASIAISCSSVLPCHAQVGTAASSAFVPGTGIELTQVGDDFEDPNWNYIPNDPKSSEDINEQQNTPIGKSANGRWFEGIKRGHPDVVRRVDTPPGGLPGSQGALLLQSLHTGIPNRPSHTMHQEDFIGNVQYALGGTISVTQAPSVTTRVYLPPIAEWEHRSGPHFAFRIALETTKLETKKRFLFTSKSEEDEIYWPGLFIVLDSKYQTGQPDDYAYFRVRANRNGGDFKGPQITTTGWWTLGMSCSQDGMVHYYAKPGVENLTAADYITSQYPYGYRCESFRSFFYNVVNGDNGRDWTTAWIVDDPKVFVQNNARIARRP